MGDIPDELPLPPSRLDPEALGNLPLPPDRLNPAPTLAGRVPSGESQFATPDAGGQAPQQVQLPPREPGTSIASQPQPSRADFFRHMLGDFFYAAGTGLAAAGHGPGSFGRGLGAGLTALPNRDILNQQLDIQRQQAEGLAAYHKAQAEAQNIRYGGVTLPGGQVISAQDYARLQGQEDRAGATLGAAAMNTASRERIAQWNNATRQSMAQIQANVKAGKEPTDPIYQITKRLNPELDPTSPEFAKAWEDLRMKERTDPGVKRMMALVYERARTTPFETVEPGTNIPTTISNLEALQTGAPKVSFGAQQKFGGTYAVYNDAYGVLNSVNDLVGPEKGKINLDNKDVASRIAAGYAAIKDPAAKGLAGEVLSNILARQPINNDLSDDERKLVLLMAQGKAAATGLRGIMGQAGTNEMQQRLDSALMPGPQGAASNKAFKQQVQLMGNLLDRFSVGLPQAGLNAPGTPTALENKGVGTPPANLLKEGMVTHFENGQSWTLKNGKPQQVGVK